MPYNYSKLLGRIKEFDYTQKSLAKAIGKDEGTISLKLNGKGEFKAGEIDSICRVLDIPNDKIGEYFFCSVSLDSRTQGGQHEFPKEGICDQA